MGDRTPRRGEAAGVLAVPVAVMAALGWRLLRTVAVPGAVDHPSQFARMEWFRSAMATGRDPLGFTPALGGGWPDLQLYPPGVASLGWFFADVVRTGPTTGYWLVVVVAWFLPALAGAATLRWVGARPSTAALGGIVVGALSFGYSGTRGGAAIGVLGARISLAASVLLIGLVVRARRRWSDRSPGPWDLLAIGTSAFATAWFHAFFLPGTVLAVVVLLALPGPRPRARLALGLAASAGFLLAGWWWLGAVGLHDLAVPIDRAPGETVVDHLLHPAFDTFGGIDWLVLAVAAALTVARSVRRRPGPAPGEAAGSTPRFALDGPMVLVVPLAAAAVALLVAALDTALGSGQLDASRVVDGGYVWAGLVASMGVETIGPTRRSSARTLVTVACGVLWVGLQWRGLPPSAFADSIDAVEQRGPAAVWPLLRGGEGRVAFTAGSFEDESSIWTLTHARTGREPAIGGLLQAQLQHGPGASRLVGHGNDLDDRSIFGIAWADLAADPGRLRTVHDWLVELRITTVVSERRAGVTPQPADVLAAAPALFRRAGGSGALDVWDVLGADPAVVVPDRVRLIEGAGWIATDPEARDGLVATAGLDRWRQPVVVVPPSRRAAIEPVEPTGARWRLVGPAAALPAGVGAVVAARRARRP